jgi:hypothetical protein
MKAAADCPPSEQRLNQVNNKVNTGGKNNNSKHD